MHNGRKRIRGRLAALLAAALFALTLIPTALADTDENTVRVSKQPDQLVLQLGVRWAGVEFELRTDAGLFPVPVVVDESGVLTMDLGGSTTYTFTCMSSSVPIPDPEQSQAVEQEQTPPDGRTHTAAACSGACPANYARMANDDFSGWTGGHWRRICSHSDQQAPPGRLRRMGGRGGVTAENPLSY